MSPEQKLPLVMSGSNPIEFAFGLVICEMLTGCRPSLSRTSASESRSQLNVWLQGQFRKNLNGRARNVIRRCLEFRPESRFQQVGDIVAAIDGTRERKRRRWAVASAMVATALALVVAVAAPEEGPHVIDAAPLTSEAGLAASPSISPDGKWVVYMSDRAESGNLDVDPTGNGRRAKTSDDASRRRFRSECFT